MKRIILTLGILFSVLTVKAQSNIVDFDYTKVFSINSMWIDFNQDKKAQSDEIYNLPDNMGEVFIEYKDFGSAGNLMKFRLTLKKQDGSDKEMFKKTLDDVTFIKVDDIYSVLDKFGDRYFALTKENGVCSLIISNPAILMR